jgi:hypothetical protein
VRKNSLFVVKSGAIVAQMGPKLADSGVFAHPPARGELPFDPHFRG